MLKQAQWVICMQVPIWEPLIRRLEQKRKENERGVERERDLIDMDNSVVIAGERQVGRMEEGIDRINGDENNI